MLQPDYLPKPSLITEAAKIAEMISIYFHGLVGRITLGAGDQSMSIIPGHGGSFFEVDPVWGMAIAICVC
jgi:hypothetical protein